MRRNRLADAGEPASLLAGQFDRASVDRRAEHITLEKPPLRPPGPPVTAQRLQQFGREHHVAILLAPALFDTDDHALTIDIRGLQVNGLGDAQARGVTSSQNRSMLGAAHTAQKLEDFLRAQDYGQLLWLLRRRDDVLEGPVLFQG